MASTADHVPPDEHKSLGILDVGSNGSDSSGCQEHECGEAPCSILCSLRCKQGTVQ